MRVRHWFVLVATGTWLLPASRVERRGVTQEGVTVTVVIDGATTARGQIGVALFASDAGFPERPDQAIRRQLQPWRAPVDSVIFRDVPPGRYAVAVHHDVDADGTLKKSMIGVPQEPWGVSRDVRHRMRAPRFQEAAVDVRGDTRLAVRVAK